MDAYWEYRILSWLRWRETVIDENKQAYPELDEKRAMITKLIRVEEESFAKTIDQGLQILEKLIDHAENNLLSGEDAFRLNDTYGFPIDLTKEILAERGMAVAEDIFYRLMKEQKERARAARKNAGADAWAGEEDILDDLPETAFVGYTTLETTAKVLAIVKNGNVFSSAKEGDNVIVILDQTPFYAEGGGQVGDTGVLKNSGALVNVTDTTKNQSKLFLHHAFVAKGELIVDETVTAGIHSMLRRDIMCNHTAAHLLQAALRNVLGDHVEQAGQMVNDKEVRFDFTHFSALTPEEITKVEQEVNLIIRRAIDVECREMPIEEAKKPRSNGTVWRKVRRYCTCCICW